MNIYQIYRIALFDAFAGRVSSINLRINRKQCIIMRLLCMLGFRAFMVASIL